MAVGSNLVKTKHPDKIATNHRALVRWRGKKFHAALWSPWSGQRDAHFLERRRFDLADPLGRDAELLGDQ